MENQLYVVYDSVAQRYMQVYAFASEAQANRSLPLALVDKFHSLSDYELCHIGSIDVETGVVKTSAPKRLAWKSDALSLSDQIVNDIQRREDARVFLSQQAQLNDNRR